MPPLAVRRKATPEPARALSAEIDGAGERLAGFERLITHLATHFINVPSEEINGAVRTALQKFGEFARLHRASIVLFDETRTVFEKTYEWNAEGVEPGAETVLGEPISQFGWVHEQIFANRVMMIGGPDDFPPEAMAERAAYGRHGVGSTLIVPMMARGGPIGCLSFSMEDLKTWTREDINLLEIAAEMFVNAFERKRTEDLAARYAKELERSNEDLVDFAYHASHDLQEPLRMVTGYCELLEKRCGDSLKPEAHELVGHAVSGARRMQELINGLLAYARIGAKLGLPHSTDCGTLLEVTLENLAPMIEGTGAEITHDPLPIVVADTMQLGQVMQNILGNAMKFARGVPRIHVSCEERPTEHVLSIRDNGIGIDASKAERVFEPFVRLHTPDEYPGTGIGLSICKKIIERHGGRIWVEAAPEGGSVFSFTIPRRERMIAEAAAAVSAVEGAREPRWRQ
jgi:signal transduction histidine kinase